MIDTCPENESSQNRTHEDAGRAVSSSRRAHHVNAHRAIRSNYVIIFVAAVVAVRQIFDEYYCMAASKNVAYVNGVGRTSERIFRGFEVRRGSRFLAVLQLGAVSNFAVVSERDRIFVGHNVWCRAYYSTRWRYEFMVYNTQWIA